MNIREYHAKEEISNSDLNLLAKSPLHYKNKEKHETTPNMLLGSIVHKLVLEPESFSDDFALEPVVNKRTNAGKEELEKFYKTLKDGQQAISSETYDTAKKMSEEILKMKESSFFLKDGKAEHSYFGTLEGVRCKCRPDFYNEKLGLIVDIKTTADASKGGFLKAVANFNYHMQAAFYTDLLRRLGEEANKFLFVAVESKAPYMVGFYELDEQALEMGRDRYKTLLARYKFCKENDLWWGYSEFNGEEVNPIQTLSLPAWKMYEAI